MSISFIGLAVGSALTAPLVFTLLEYQDWRWVFVELGVLGFLWCAVWYTWFRNRPEDHKSVDEAELRWIRADPAQSVGIHHSFSRVSWTKMFSSSNMIFICLMYFAYGYGLYFYITWLPTYLIEALGFDRNTTKWMAALPWILSAPTFGFGGWLTDWLARSTGSLKLARCGVGAVGYAASALALLVVPQIKDRMLAGAIVAVALSFQTMTVSAAWAVCLDVGRQSAGVVTGFMNTVGNLGGAIAPLVVGYTVKNLGSWRMPFYVMTAVLLFGVVMWLLVDPRRPVLKP